MFILAIESSCDETSIAVVKDGNTVLSNIIATQIDIHKEFGGVVPEIASRQHIKNISTVFKMALEKAEIDIKDISYIAVTNTPGLIGSLLVGLMFAKGLSYANSIPLIPVNHIDGHIFSSFIDNKPELPMLTLVASGGHTSLYLMKEDLSLNLLGETLDDAIGECYDKIARILSLPYPGGPSIEKLALEGKNNIMIPIPKIDKYDFSFSGIKTFVTNYVNQKNMKKEEYIKADVANSFQETVFKFITNKLITAKNEFNVKSISIVGGVSANKALRNFLESEKEFNNIKIIFPKMEYCTDNAAMIGAAAYFKNIKEKNLNVDAIDTKRKKQTERRGT